MAKTLSFGRALNTHLLRGPLLSSNCFKGTYYNFLSSICILNIEGYDKPLNGLSWFFLVRTLYTKEAMGLDGYIQTRERVATQFVNMTDKFKAKMTEFVEPKAANMIFTEDLKNMVHLAENNEDDLKLVTDMVLR